MGTGGQSGPQGTPTAGAFVVGASHLSPPPQAGGQDESAGWGRAGGEKDVSNNRSHRDFP